MLNYKNKSNPDLLQIARSVAIAKGIDYSAIMKIISTSIEDSVKKYYGITSISSSVDTNTGAISINREYYVVKNKSEAMQEAERIAADKKYSISDFIIDLDSALRIYPNATVDSTFKMPVDIHKSIEYRFMNNVKNTIMQKLAEAEREQLYKKYSSREGEIVFGKIIRIETHAFIVNINGNELELPLKEILKSDKGRNADSILACIHVAPNAHKIYLSRISKEFVEGLLTREVPEIQERTINIMASARYPGEKTKIAVSSIDPNINAVGSCIGYKGVRIKNISKEVNERVDIIQFSSDIPTFIERSLSSDLVRVISIQKNDADDSYIAVVSDDKFSTAIGKGGRNVKLTSQLVGVKITIVGEDSAAKDRMGKFNSISETLSKTLDVEDIIAQLLASEGFDSVESIANSEITSIAKIEGFNEGIASAIISRANEYMDSEKNQFLSTIADEQLCEILKQYPMIIEIMIKDNINTPQKLAELSIDDFEEMLESNEIPSDYICEETMGKIIMQARKLDNE